jgi:hypothetical protein
MKEFWLNLLNFLGLAYWVEIVTEYPRCTYYFGPFTSKQEAQQAQTGYVEDLQQENAQGIVALVKRTKPIDLTLFDDKEDARQMGKIPVFSSQTF